MSEYYTIKEETEGLYKEKGSKFVASAFPVYNENDIQENLQLLKKRFHDARHHCYAWLLGMDEQIWRANDDGEPNHSAGDPILGQIRSHGLTNTLVVVVRYFGGTKLGVGGLIHAYKTAADSALSKSKKRLIYEKVALRLFFTYETLSIVERLVQTYEMEVALRDFQSSCVIHGHLKKDLFQSFGKEVDAIHQLKMEIDESQSG